MPACSACTPHVSLHIYIKHISRDDALACRRFNACMLPLWLPARPLAHLPVPVPPASPRHLRGVGFWRVPLVAGQLSGA